MKLTAVLGVLMLQAVTGTQPPVAKPEYLRWQRAMTVPANAGQACAVLDGAIFPHAAPSLRDLRVFAGAQEIPYVITLSQTATDATEPLTVLNLGSSEGKIAFDLHMPERPYSDVLLKLAGQDFLAQATVWGERTPGAKPQERTSLGTFTLFDLTTQRLSRNMTLPLVESTFPLLHVELAVSSAPQAAAPIHATPAMVVGAEAPPSRTAQTLYTVVAQTTAVTTVGRETKATIQVPARLPVERVSFVVAPEFHGNFSRDVTITATPEPGHPSGASEERSIAEGIASDADLGHGELPVETVSGTILRVHTTEAGKEIRTERLEVPAVIGANLQSPAKVEIALANGDDRPIPVTAVRLEMRERRLCFDAGPERTAGLMLDYGDPALEAPVYDYQRLFQPSVAAAVATLGPELANPLFHPRPTAAKPFTERHPEVVWIALIAVVCVLGMVALRSAQRVQTRG